MIAIQKSPDSEQKLAILSQDSKYDLACSCATAKDQHRRRSQEDKWIYPVVLPNGGRTFLFKTLLSNECVNNCKYCPLRTGSASRRCSLTPDETARLFLAYYRARKVSGLFLSSAVPKNPDSTMEAINGVALRLRRSQFRGYIHLKVIPGASDAAIRQSLSLATAVSLNIETAGESNFRQLSTTKKYERDILRPIQLISQWTQKGAEYAGVKQTTQFVVGAAQETDKDILSYSWKLYKKWRLSRIYFSAYQRGSGAQELPGENSTRTNQELLSREHRLYQADWLIRKYGFDASEIPTDTEGNLSLTADPKEMWAKQNLSFFPVKINTDDPERLLRVPGIGQIAVDRILEFRRSGARIRSLQELGKVTKVLKKAEPYLEF